jgi:hypothetical protein
MTDAFRITPRIAAFALLIAVAAASGCGSNEPKLYPASGKILIDNKAPEHATVVFHPVAGGDPDRPKPHGKVEADGSFTLTSVSAGDGAPAGDYLVTVELWLTSGRGDEGPKSRLPAKFAKPETSGLKATISEGPNELPTFVLKK